MNNQLSHVPVLKIRSWDVVKLAHKKKVYHFEIELITGKTSFTFLRFIVILLKLLKEQKKVNQHLNSSKFSPQFRASHKHSLYHFQIKLMLQTKAGQMKEFTQNSMLTILLSRTGV